MNDWVNLNSNFYSNGGVNFGLRYNRRTGDIEIRERDILGGFNSSVVLYQNGVWYSDALRITGGAEPLFSYEDGDVLQANPIETQKAKQLNIDARRFAYQAYVTLGGNNKGLSINSTALPQNQRGSASITNSVPGANPGVAKVVPALTTPQGLSGIWDALKGGLPDPGNFDTIPTPWKNLLKYPIDILENRQDTLRITQVEYQSPNKDIFDQDIKDILTKGIIRGSVKKSLKGTVILPMPNNPSDSNTADWGEDNMDSMTTAATSLAVNKTGLMVGGLAGAKGLGGLLSLLGNPGAGSLISNLPPIALRGILYGMSTNNAATKAALQSYILSKYGFEVPPESILARGAGIVPNSNLQLLFKNVQLRTFTFAYKLSPRSEEEAKEVNMILRFFKQGMAAKKGSAGTTLYLKTPNVFKLEYKTGNEDIKGINKFKICALTSFNVNYAPNGQWSAYEGGQPSSVVMTMGFKELEPVYENDYKSTSDIEFDVPPVQSDEIGY